MVFHVLSRGVGRMRLFNKDQSYGSESWISKTAKKLGLESTMRRRRRPGKVAPKPQY